MLKITHYKQIKMRYYLTLARMVIIMILAGIIGEFSHVAAVQHAFAGIRVCVCVLIFNAVLKLWKNAVKDYKAALIFAAVLALSLLTDITPVVPILAAAVAGILIKAVGGAKK